MNDVMTRKASFDEVSWALSDVRRKHTKIAAEDGLTFLEFLQNHKRVEACTQEQDEVCILLGWSHQVHQQMDHEEIMRQMTVEQ